MSADFLLELLSEEIPARMQEKACADLARLFEGELAKAGLKAGGIETFATPRRLALIARALPLATDPVREETKGPRASAPPQALEGFLRKTGLVREDLVERDGVLFAVVERHGRPIAAVLADAIPAIVRGFPWPKSMRWGEASAATASLRWVRPLQGIVALLGEMVVPCEVDGIASGAVTVGHRFHHPGPITIGSAEDYAFKLRAAHVIVDPAERRRLIEEGAAAAAAAEGLTVVADPGLVAENAGLTEWPVPLLGRFDPAFLQVPREVIQLTMRTNQKYFACVDGEGRLAPAFICTANIQATDGGAGVIAGNRKVLAARLSDARFFWEQDLKVPLEEQRKKLAQIVFHEKLGTVADKVERVAKLARWLVDEGIVPPAAKGSTPALSASVTPAEAGVDAPGDMPREDSNVDPGFRRGDEEGSGDPDRARLADMAEQAARLCKADLVTGMVGEFPELQGIMGGYYARAEGYPDEVADAIRDHYKPVGQSDEVPTAPVAVTIALADKLESLLSFWSAGEKPTGSRDPYALRRSSLSILAILLHNNLRLSIASVPLLALDVEAARRIVEEYYAYASKAVADGTLAPERVKAIDTSNEDGSLVETVKLFWGGSFSFADPVRAFIADRLKVQQREAGVRHDLIDAVFALGGEDDLVRLLARVKALQAFVGTEDGANLLAGYKRAANILKKEGWAEDAVAAATPAAHAPAPEEAALVAALDRTEPEAACAVAAEAFEAAMAALAGLRAPIDAFFEKVTVNDPDPDKRTARLRLLARVRAAVHQVADFSRIEG